MQILRFQCASLQNANMGILQDVAEGSWNIETLQMDAINLYDLIGFIYGYTDKPLKPIGTLL